MSHVPLSLDLPGQLEALKSLLGIEALTPLLRKEINNAIGLHVAVLEDPEKDDLEYRQLVATTFRRLMRHWAELYEDLVHRAALITNIINFQKLLLSKFVEDYSGLPCPLSGALLDFALERNAFVEEHFNGGDRREGPIDFYNMMVVLPLREMMLDRRHVQSILRTIATSEGHPGQVKQLVDQRDWQGLASTIIKDRQLALDFFTHIRPMSVTFMPTAGFSAEVLRGLDKVQNMYFAALSSPSVFTLTSHAKQLSGIDLSIAGPAQSSWTGFAKSLYQSILKGLHGRGLETDANTADTTRLFEPGQAG